MPLPALSVRLAAISVPLPALSVPLPALSVRYPARSAAGLARIHAACTFARYRHRSRTYVLGSAPHAAATRRKQIGATRDQLLQRECNPWWLRSAQRSCFGLLRRRTPTRWLRESRSSSPPAGSTSCTRCKSAPAVRGVTSSINSVIRTGGSMKSTYKYS